MALLFAGLVLLGVGRVFLVLSFAPAAKIFFFVAGVLLCSVALFIHDRRSKVAMRIFSILLHAGALILCCILVLSHFCCSWRKASSREANRSQRGECEGATGIARRGSRHRTADHRYAAEIGTFPSRGRLAGHSRHQSEEAGCVKAVRDGFRASSTGCEEGHSPRARQKDKFPVALADFSRRIQSLRAARQSGQPGNPRYSV